MKQHEATATWGFEEERHVECRCGAVFVGRASKQDVVRSGAEVAQARADEQLQAHVAETGGAG